jgi:hypothetical protein
VTEQILKHDQHLLDQKFHEYKLAALTGILARWQIDWKAFGEEDADSISVTCDIIARAMERLDRAEGGS